MKYYLSIPEPCNEGWENMTPKENGRHCSSCDKVVVDFSNTPSREVLKYVKEHKNVCGRLKSSQMDVPIQYNTPLQALGNKWVFTAAAIFALSGHAMAQEPVQDTGSFLVERLAIAKQNVVVQPDSGFFELKGIVIDEETNESIPFAAISLEDSAGVMLYATATDFDGNFTLKVDELSTENLTLKVRSSSYKDVVLTNVEIPRGESLRIELKLEPEVLGGLIIVGSIAPMVDQSNQYLLEQQRKYFQR